MLPNTILCLLIMAAYSFGQERINIETKEDSESFTIQNDNKSNNGTSLLEISRDKPISMSNTQIIKQEFFEQSSSIRYDIGNNLTENNTSKSLISNDSVTDINSDLILNKTIDDNLNITLNLEQFQIESSSNENENIEVTTSIPIEVNDNKEVTTFNILNDAVTVTNYEVTQLNDDYKTVIIFTNLYSPGDESEELDGQIFGNNEQNETSNDDIDLKKDNHTDLNNDERIDEEVTDKIYFMNEVINSTDTNNLPKLTENLNLTTDEFDMEIPEEKFNIIPVFSKNQVRNFIATNSTVKSNINISNNDTVLVKENENDAISSNPVILENDAVMINDTSETVDTGGNVNNIRQNKSSLYISRRTQQNRKDIKTLIEEKRRLSQIKRIPSYKINMTRLNRDTVQRINTPNVDKPLLPPIQTRFPLIFLSNVQSKDSSLQNNTETEVKADIFALEESLRKSTNNCARECDSSKSMTCRYELTLEWFHTMSKACFSCPRNISDCFRPHCIPADGVKRTIAVINRSLPGPLIQVCEGDRIIAKVTNRMMESTTTIHWHGQHQMLTPFMDGVPSVTQCPIVPGASFTYSFIATQPGTHFYHSHSGIQRGDGAFGGLIIRRSQSKERHKWTYDHDLPEHTIMVLDWTHRLGLQTFTHHHHAGGSNKPETILVNGRGITSDRNLPPASFTVTKDQRYRFRLINAGVLNCPIRISIDEHKLTIIATDGNDIQPYNVDWLVTYAGERWDFVIEAKADVSNYWMRFIGLMDCDERFTSAHQGAVLHYRGASISLPDGPLEYNTTMISPPLERPPKILNALNAGMSDGTTLVHQLSSLARTQPWLAQRQPDKKLILAYDFNPLDNELFHKANMYGFSQVLDVSSRVFTPQLNHVSLSLPPFPLLTQSNQLTPEMLCNNKDQEICKKSYCECTNIIEINLGDVVEIMFIDQGFAYDANHPFHLHGHSFYVVGMDRLGQNVTSQKVLDLDAKGLIARNLGAAPLKDTVTVPDGGYTIIRFLANNPGFWLLHCHIDFHVEVGMAVVLKVGQTSDFPIAPPSFPTCGDFDPTLMNSTGSETLTEPPGNSFDDVVNTLFDSVVNPSFGSRWKYNTSSSTNIKTPCLYTTLCVLIVLLGPRYYYINSGI